MSETGLAAFDSTVQTTNIWLNEVTENTGWHDRQRAYHALRVVLQALRDHLTVEEAADLGAQLPMLIRGMYYEGWRPGAVPSKSRGQKEFIAQIAATFPDDQDVDVPRLIRAVVRVVEKHVTAGEISDVKGVLPKGIRALLP